MSRIKDKPITPSYVRSSIDRYQKNSVKRIVVVFYYDTDMVLIEKLDSLENMSGYIKNLISLDIKENPDLTPSSESKDGLRRYSNSEKKRVNFLVNKTDEADILERLSAKKNRNDYIKMLINKDITSPVSNHVNDRQL